VETPFIKGVDVRSDAQANRERILAAAEEVFGAAGATGSTEEVARRAGVGVGTVFRHFPTKQALLEATVIRHFALLTEQARALADATHPGTALRGLIETMVGAGAAKLVLVNLLVEEAGSSAAAVGAATDLRAAVAVVLTKAQDAGAVRADVTVDEVYLLIRGLSQAAATAPADPIVLRRALAIVLDGLAPAGA
jgi:AcrR family transcriptional regulator